MGLFRAILRALSNTSRSRTRSGQSTPTGNVVRFDARCPAKGPWTPGPPPAPRHLQKLIGRCHVIDGDTIAIDHVHIRLSGIDAPELDHPYGIKAKWALVNLCKGQVVTAVFDGSSSYDRGVARCYLPDGRELSAEMVKLGLALYWKKYSGGRYRALEPPEARRLLWRADARQKGRFPPAGDS